MFSTCSQYTLSLVLFFFFACVFLNEEKNEEKSGERGSLRGVWEAQVQSATLHYDHSFGFCPLYSVFRANSVFKPQSVCGAGCTEQARVIRCFHLVIWGKVRLDTSEEHGFIYDAGCGAREYQRCTSFFYIGRQLIATSLELPFSSLSHPLWANIIRSFRFGKLQTTCTCVREIERI